MKNGSGLRCLLRIDLRALGARAHLTSPITSTQTRIKTRVGLFLLRNRLDGKEQIQNAQHKSWAAAAPAEHLSLYLLDARLLPLQAEMEILISLFQFKSYY